METTRYGSCTLLLEDGTVFTGKAAGITGTAVGEICFNTGMTGYQEVFTDPSYYGQILVATNAHIGNYGTKYTEVESRHIQIAGFICKNFADIFNRPMADQSLQAYFEEQNLVCIHGIDTRALVRHIRHQGAMNAVISSEHKDIETLKDILDRTPKMEGLELASKVSTPNTYFYGNEHARFRVAALDFGMKENILRCLSARDCYVGVFPAKTTFDELKKFNPDGYFLSNGPGDPAAMDYAIRTTQEILKSNKPLFGICLGHQILALAMGVPTYKLHHGHRGINHPVLNVQTGKCEITSQNHGFGVALEAMEAHQDVVEVTHVNLNDQTVEGLRVKNKKAFSVQFHPESSPGPHDSRYLFDQFIESMINTKVSVSV
jgi:carbamoyl-phosphate synthase small subunit